MKNSKARSKCHNKASKLSNFIKRNGVEKIKGLEKNFRIRIGDYRIIFHVDKMEKTIYVAYIEARKRVYERLSRM